MEKAQVESSFTIHYSPFWGESFLYCVDGGSEHCHKMAAVIMHGGEGIIINGPCVMEQVESVVCLISFL